MVSRLQRWISKHSFEVVLVTRGFFAFPSTRCRGCALLMKAKECITAD
jgi:hypothetical protein